MMSAFIARGSIVRQLDLIQGCLVSKIVVLPCVLVGSIGLKICPCVQVADRAKYHNT
jgi:hypothetical protein